MDLATTSLASFSSWPLDWVIVIVIVFALALETYRAGMGKAAALSIALPLTHVSLLWLPAAAGIGGFVQQLSTPIAQVGIFLTVLSMLFVFIYRMFFAYDAGSKSIVQSAISAIATTAIIVLFWALAPGLNTLLPLSAPFAMLASESYRVYVLVVSYLALAIARG